MLKKPLLSSVKIAGLRNELKLCQLLVMLGQIPSIIEQLDSGPIHRQISDKMDPESTTPGFNLANGPESHK